MIGKVCFLSKEQKPCLQAAASTYPSRTRISRHLDYAREAVTVYCVFDWEGGEGGKRADFAYADPSPKTLVTTP